MGIQTRKLAFLMLALQILIQATVVECGFGSSLAGSLAGSYIGKMIGGKNKHKDEHPKTTIERRETFPNGCYKQVIKEPDTFNHRMMTATEQLVCPPNVPPPVGIPGVVPQQFQPQQLIPGVAAQPQVYILSKTTYSSGSAKNKLQTGCAALTAVVLFVYFM